MNRLATYQTISKDWEYNPMADRFIYQHGVFTVTRDLPKTKRAYCETCQVFIDADTGEREK